MIKFGPKYSKLKTDLKLVRNRLKILQEKKCELSEKLKKDIANCIAEEKFSKAKIKAQTVLRYQASVETMEIIEMLCEQFLDRYSIFQDKKELDISLAQIITNLVWVTPYFQSEVTELQGILKQISVKYGYKFIQSALQNKKKTVSFDLIERVKFLNPSENEVHLCLQRIASHFDVPKEKVTAMNLYFLHAHHHKMYVPFKFQDKKLDLLQLDKTLENSHEHIEIVKKRRMSSVDSPLKDSKYLDEFKISQSSLKPESMDKHLLENLSELNGGCRQSKLSFDNTEIKKSDIYSAERSFEKLYPRKEDSMFKIDDNENICDYKPNGNDENKDAFVFYKKLDKDMNQDCEMFHGDEPPPSYNDVVRVPLPETSKLNTEFFENDDLSNLDDCSVFPTCPCDLPGDLPEVLSDI